MEFRNAEILCLKTHLRYMSYKEPTDKENAVINLGLA